MVTTRYALIFVLSLAAILSAGQASAQTHVIANSADWKDVYSSVLYANLEGYASNFLTSSKHSTIILFSIPRERDVLAITSSQNRFVVGYEQIIRGRGFADVEEIVLNDVNLQLAQRLPDIHNFVILDGSYGYNAISVAPYAAISGSYVLFADRNNINRIVDFLDGQGVDRMIIYGQVDREVKTELAKYDAEIIFNGDRFEDNVAITKEYLKIRPRKQTLMTNGEFIEAGIMDGTDPVLFIGRANVPDVTREFVQSSDIDVGILIGNELIG
ncbi:MAG: hypothetical protein ABIH41_04390, partial [Nanoarchaeota archaeon]